MKPYLKLMRPHHYIKNFLVFAALACSGQLFDPGKLLSGGLGFVAFCLISSVVYIINDIRDVEKDRQHPTKCKRPIAAGTVSIKNAWLLAAVLMVLALVCNFLTGRSLPTLLLLLYLVLNLAYSFGLKNIPIVDVTILVSGFLKKSRSFAYGDIVHQTVLIAGGSLMAEVYFENGSAITVQAHMDGGIAFLDYAFARWCEVKGLNPKECAFHDPSKFRWFPTEEEPGEEEDA
jgi:hypothetical protein